MNNAMFSGRDRRLGFECSASWDVATPSSGIEIRQRMIVQNTADLSGDYRQMQFAAAFFETHRSHIRKRSPREHGALSLVGRAFAP